MQSTQQFTKDQIEAFGSAVKDLKHYVTEKDGEDLLLWLNQLLYSGDPVHAATGSTVKSLLGSVAKSSAFTIKDGHPVLKTPNTIATAVLETIQSHPQLRAQFEYGVRKASGELSERSRSRPASRNNALTRALNDLDFTVAFKHFDETHPFDSPNQAEYLKRFLGIKGPAIISGMKAVNEAIWQMTETGRINPPTKAKVLAFARKIGTSPKLNTSGRDIVVVGEPRSVLDGKSFGENVLEELLSNPEFETQVFKSIRRSWNRRYAAGEAGSSRVDHVVRPETLKESVFELPLATAPELALELAPG